MVPMSRGTEIYLKLDIKLNYKEGGSCDVLKLEGDPTSRQSF